MMIAITKDLIASVLALIVHSLHCDLDLHLQQRTRADTISPQLHG
jgi:hypothetical protein